MVAPWPSACSGAMYCGVPMIECSRVSLVCASRIFEIPKSSTFTISRPSPGRDERNRFEGLRSRWTTPWACAADSAETT